MAPRFSPLRRVRPEAGGDAPDARWQRVLVVDDSTDSRESLATYLDLKGLRVDTAPDGPGALSAVRGFRPGFVLLDLGLPGMDGWEVAQHLREEHGRECPVLIATSGHAEPAARRRSVAVGFREHLAKPLDLKRLVRLLHRSPQAFGT